MPRRKISFVEGEHYHIYNRGALRGTLFYTFDAYWMFIHLLNHYSAQHHIEVIAVCLMPNHFHLLVRVLEGGDVSKMMQRLGVSFSKRTNLHLRRVGTIFEGRFKAKHVSDESYFLELIRYIHANPVKDGLVENLADWEFTTFHENMGRRRAIRCTRLPVAERFATPREFEEFILSLRTDSKVSNALFARSLAEIRAD